MGLIGVLWVLFCCFWSWEFHVLFCLVNFHCFSLDFYCFQLYLFIVTFG